MVYFNLNQIKKASKFQFHRLQKRKERENIQPASFLTALANGCRACYKDPSYLHVDQMDFVWVDYLPGHEINSNWEPSLTPPPSLGGVLDCSVE